jgi:MarR family transcriptional regulator, organic hydroperoxide resistance regulator
MKEDQLLLSNQLCFPLYSLSRLITKAYKPHLQKMGLTYPQYLVLMVLWEKDNLTVNQIAKKLILNTNTLSPLLQRMEKMEVLQRVQSKSDERVTQVRLSEKGKAFKKDSLCIPGKLMSKLETPNRDFEDISQLKDTLFELVELLSEHSK